MLSWPDIAFVMELMDKREELARPRKNTINPHRAIPMELSASFADFRGFAGGLSIRTSTSP